MVLPKHGLIVRKEWLDLIFSGHKRLEIRGVSTSKRGRVGLIQSGSGLVVGEVEITDSFTIHRWQFRQFFEEHVVDQSTLDSLKYSTIHAWQLQNPVKYEVPVAYKHPQGAVQWVVLTPDPNPKKRGSRKMKRPARH